jgi:hypothetical protein
MHQRKIKYVTLFNCLIKQKANLKASSHAQIEGEQAPESAFVAETGVVLFFEGPMKIMSWNYVDVLFLFHLPKAKCAKVNLDQSMYYEIEKRLQERNMRKKV